MSAAWMNLNMVIHSPGVQEIWIISNFDDFSCTTFMSLTSPTEFGKCPSFQVEFCAVGSHATKNQVGSDYMASVRYTHSGFGDLSQPQLNVFDGIKKYNIPHGGSVLTAN